MNKKFILGLLVGVSISYFNAASAYDSVLSERLTSCTPTKDYNAGSSTLYQISGLTGSTCIYKIQYTSGNKPDLICKVPFSKMREVANANPISAQRLRNQYCVISIKSLNRSKTVYY